VGGVGENCNTREVNSGGRRVAGTFYPHSKAACKLNLVDDRRPDPVEDIKPACVENSNYCRYCKKRKQYLGQPSTLHR